MGPSIDAESKDAQSKEIYTVTGLLLQSRMLREYPETEIEKRMRYIENKVASEIES